MSLIVFNVTVELQLNGITKLLSRKYDKFDHVMLICVRYTIRYSINDLFMDITRNALFLVRYAQHSEPASLPWGLGSLLVLTLNTNQTNQTSHIWRDKLLAMWPSFS